MVPTHKTILLQYFASDSLIPMLGPKHKGGVHPLYIIKKEYIRFFLCITALQITYLDVTIILM
jgi:hypothetical protein